MIRQLLSIAKNTFQESVRQPIFAVLILVAALALTLNPALAAYTLDDDNKLLLDMGLSTLFIAGLLLAAFTATGVLGQEIRLKTALTVVSKPVPRPLFVLGKFLGVTAALAMAFWTLAALFLLTERHQVMQTASDTFDGPVWTFGGLAALLSLVAATAGNYLYRWSFPSTFATWLAVLTTLAWLLVLVIGKGWILQSPATDFHPQLMIGLLMIFEAVLILTGVAIAVSTRLGQIMTLIVCVGVFFLGLVANYLAQTVRDAMGAIADPSVLERAALAGAGALLQAAPNLQLLWPGDALTQDHPITVGHLGWVTGYTALYVVGLLSLAVALFQTRDVA